MRVPPEEGSEGAFSVATASGVVMVECVDGDNGKLLIFLCRHFED